MPDVDGCRSETGFSPSPDSAASPSRWPGAGALGGARCPPSLDFGQAATLVQSYSTVLFTLTRRTTVVPGEWVLVLGAGGGIGLAAVDVARALGARVIAAASSDATTRRGEGDGSRGDHRVRGART